MQKKKKINQGAYFLNTSCIISPPSRVRPWRAKQTHSDDEHWKAHRDPDHTQIFSLTICLQCWSMPFRKYSVLVLKMMLNYFFSPMFSQMIWQFFIVFLVEGFLSTLMCFLYDCLFTVWKLLYVNAQSWQIFSVFFFLSFFLEQQWCHFWLQLFDFIYIFFFPLKNYFHFLELSLADIKQKWLKK